MLNELIIIEDMPRSAHYGELVSLDLEMWDMEKDRLHRPHGTFACLSIALADSPGMAYQFYDPQDIREALKRLGAGRWVLQNAVFDLRQLRRWATIEPRPTWDTMLVDQELWGGYHSTFDLNSLSIRWLERPMDKELQKSFSGGREMSPEQKRYAAQDAVTTLAVAQEQMAYIEHTQEPFDFYWDADSPMIWAVLDMPGVRVDVGGWLKLADTFTAKADAIRSTMAINPGSWQQVQKKINELTGFQIPSTDEEHLTELKAKLIAKGRSKGLDFIDAVLEYRHYSKAAGTYGYKWIEKYIEEGDLVYTNWKICGASDTSRISGTDPSLQVIPARKIPEFRNLFIAREGNILVGADVAQQEPRVLAKLSGDETLIRELQAGISPHITTGKLIFQDPNFSKADKVRYGIAKIINLGIPYGMSAAGIATTAGISEEEAEQHLATYFKHVPGVKLYMEKYRREASKREYVRNILGRRCWVNLNNYQWKNNAINAPIQSTAAHQTKIAVAHVHKESRARGIPFCLDLIVHDEFVSDVPKDLEKEYYQLSIDAWVQSGLMTLGADIPVVADPFVGENWGAKK